MPAKKQNLLFRAAALLIAIFAFMAIFISAQYSTKGLQSNPGTADSLKSDTAHELNTQAMELFRMQKNYNEKPNDKIISRAIQLLDSAIAIDSFNQAAYSNKAGILLDTGRKQDAIKTIEKSVEKNPLHAETVEFLGMMYESEGKKTEAGKYYEKALSLYENRNGSKTWFTSRGNQILLLTSLGRKSEADSLIRELPKEFPDKKKEIKDFQEFYSGFDRQKTIDEIFGRRNKN